MSLGMRRVWTDVGFDRVTLPSAEVLDGGLSCSLVCSSGSSPNPETVCVEELWVVPSVS